MADEEDKSLAASEKRLQRAREQGQAPVSRELVAAAGLAAAAMVLSFAGPALARATALRLRDMLAMAAPPAEAAGHAAQALLSAASPFLIAVGLAGAAAVLLQTGFLFHLGAAAPDLARLDPRRGLRRVFGGASAMEAAKATLKLGVVGWALWSAFAAVWPVLPQSALWSERHLLERLTAELLHVVLLVLGLQSGLAVLDVVWTRWRHAQRLRMGREELKQEQRESDGDPRIKARFRQLRQARSRRRMMAAVARATVVVTNPTHYAVALAYDRGGAAAPRVVAKGVDEVAARIRAAAEKAGVPLVANPPLARALHAVPLDAEIPAEHFRVVAELIAYVWRLRGGVGRQER